MSPRVKRILAWQRAAEPLFPVTYFVPASNCPHKGPLRPGSVFECMVCSKGGRDRSPMLAKCILFGDDDPAPGPKSPSLRDYLFAACPKGPDGKTPEYRIWPDAVDASGESKLWQDAYKLPRERTPWIVVSNGTTGYQGPLPDNVADTQGPDPEVRGQVTWASSSSIDDVELRAVHRPDSNFEHAVGRAMGCVPRDYGTHPVGCYAAAPGFPLKLIPRNEWKSRLADQDPAGRLTAIRKRGMAGQPIPSRDQDGYGYCWAHSSTSASLIMRALMGLPYADLSAFAVACIIKNYRNQGGWGAESLQWIAENGIPTSATWPQQGHSRSLDTPAMRAEAAQNKIQRWADCEDGNVDQFVTLLLSGISRSSATSTGGRTRSAPSTSSTIDPADIQGSIQTRIWNWWQGEAASPSTCPARAGSTSATTSTPRSTSTSNSRRPAKPMAEKLIQVQGAVVLAAGDTARFAPPSSTTQYHFGVATPDGSPLPADAVIGVWQGQAAKGHGVARNKPGVPYVDHVCGEGSFVVTVQSSAPEVVLSVTANSWWHRVFGWG
jgi:hypothetical protein